MAQNGKIQHRNTARFYSFIAIITFVIGLAPFLFNLVIDPYEMDEFVDIGLEKKRVSEKAHYPLWKVGHYREENTNIVILGDSRARSLRDKYWHQIGLSKAYNFAYGGATLYEIYDTFKYIKGNKNLKTLIIGIQLRSFDPDHKRGLNRVPEAIRLNQNHLKYYSNWFVSRIGIKLLQKEYGIELPALTSLRPGLVTKVRAQTISPEKPDKNNPLGPLLDPKNCNNCVLPKNVAPSPHPSRAIAHNSYFADGLGIWKNLWLPIASGRILPGKFKRQVSKNARSDWRKFNVAEKFWANLVEISAWSKQNDVQLIFVIPPTIVDMQKRIVDFGFGKLNHDFRKRLVTLGVVFDFDFNNPLTHDVERFTDAYHANYKVAKLIVGEISQFIGTDKKMAAKARKRRKDIICPILADDISNQISDDFTEVLEGRSCRIWRAKGEQ